MGTGRRTTVSIAVVAALVAGSVVTASAGAEPGGVVAAGQADCPEARARVERLEGRLTPNTCAFLRRQITFGEMPTGTPPAPGGDGHPRVAAYLDIFDPDASLWEAGSAAQRGPAVIGASIANSLRLVPSLSYEGTDVVADGSTVVFGQRNEVTLKGRTVVYPQIARNVLGDDGRTIQARRYYDRAVLFQDTLPDTAPPALFAGVADSGTGPRPPRPPPPASGRARSPPASPPGTPGTPAPSSAACPAPASRAPASPPRSPPTPDGAPTWSGCSPRPTCGCGPGRSPSAPPRRMWSGTAPPPCTTAPRPGPASPSGSWSASARAGSGSCTSTRCRWSRTRTRSASCSGGWRPSQTGRFQSWFEVALQSQICTTLPLVVS